MGLGVWGCPFPAQKHRAGENSGSTQEAEEMVDSLDLLHLWLPESGQARSVHCVPRIGRGVDGFVWPAPSLGRKAAVREWEWAGCVRAEGGAPLSSVQWSQ